MSNGVIVKDINYEQEVPPKYEHIFGKRYC